jgi:myo-inositol 2-dehydrogenase/D-chiro-inositol 1-dehydrogenase/scyllo-inositol 2-dehydrogenase (NAD+)
MSENLRICMLGAGRVGRLHSGTITRYIPGATITALVDPAEEILAQTGDDFGISGRYASLEEALDQASFDAVIITTPTFTHRHLAVLAADHGKHIFLEKPMALSLVACDAIIEAVERNGVILQMGFMRRFDPDFAAAAERIQAGEIGQPTMIKTLTHGPGLPPAWANDIRTSNGMLAEVTSHDFDTIRWLMGANIERIYVETANFKGEARGATAEHFYDNMFATIRLESGALGNISGVCPCDYGYDARAEVIGTKGIMLIGEMRGQALTVCINREEGLVTPIFRRWPERFAWAYINEIQEFVNCAQNGLSPRVTAADGRWAVAGVLAGTRSFLEERPVYLREVFEADDPAPWLEGD